MSSAEQDKPVSKATTRQLREFALASLVVLCTLGVWRWSVDGDTAKLLMFCAAGLLVGITGLIWPGAVRPLFAIAMTAATPIGWVMTMLVVGALFFGIFTPVAVLFRLLRRDRLGLRRPETESHWSPAPPPADAQSYFRQSL